MMIFNKKKKYFIPLAVYGALIAAGMPFFSSVILRLCICFILTIPMVITYRRQNKAKEITDARKELKELMEYIYTGVSAGKLLTEAVTGSIHEMEMLFGRDAGCVKALKNFKVMTQIGQSMENRLKDLSKGFSCPEAQPMLDNLYTADLYGNDLSAVIYRYLKMLSDMISTEQDISSEISQKRLEGAIMSLMPFVVCWMLYLSNKEHLYHVMDTVIGTLSYAVLFILSVISACLSVNLISGPADDPDEIFKLPLLIRISSRIKRTNKFFKVLRSIERNLNLKILHKGYAGIRYITESEEDRTGEFLAASLIAAPIVLLAPITRMDLSLWLIIYFAVLAAVGYDIHVTAQRKRLAYSADFPRFLSLLCALLYGGLSTSRAIHISARTYCDKPGKTAKDLSVLSASMKAGIPLCECIENIAYKISSNEISSALMTLSGYSKSESHAALDMLNVQCSLCWNAAKRAFVKRLETSSLKLLLPMMLQLICVGLIAVLPSLLTSGILIG